MSEEKSSPHCNRRVCFVAPLAYPAINPDCKANFGGAEIRAVRTGRELAARHPLDVSFLVFNDGALLPGFDGTVKVLKHPFYSLFPSGRQALGMRIKTAIAAYRRGCGTVGQMSVCGLRYGIPLVIHKVAEHIVMGVRRVQCKILRENGCWFLPRDEGPLSAIDADCYCTFGINITSVQVVTFCRIHGKKSVLFLASDGDLSSAIAPQSRSVTHYGLPGSQGYWALENATTVIAQTETQASELRKRFGIEASLFRSPIDVSKPVERTLRSDGEAGFFLWIGKAHSVKNPDRLLELARRTPRLSYLMVLNRADAVCYEEIVRSAPPNVEIRERVPRAELFGLMRQAQAVVNTSDFEGFPNVFLEAGVVGVPLLSWVVDPDDFIVRSSGGFVAGASWERMVENAELLCNTELNATLGRNLRQYIVAHHSLSDNVDGLFRDTLSLILT